MERLSTPDTYAVWSKNEEIRYNSTSGGAFSEFAKVIIDEDGIVVGARYNADNLVEHAMINTYDGIKELRQSKYLSSSMGNIYIKTKELLMAGKLVAFCGSPCQIAGLYSFLGKEYENLFTMDFICRGMNSPKAFKAWLCEIEKNEGSKVSKVWFKYKDGGWKTSPKRTRLDFENGTYKVYEYEKNLYMHGYLTSNLYIRPCCGNCLFKGVPRKSDITFADFWGIESELDDDKGTSMLLVNSEKGRMYFEKIRKNLEVHEKEFNSIFAGNPMFTTSAVVPENGQDFLMDLDNMSFSEAIKKYTPKIPFWKGVLNGVKKFGKKVLENRENCKVK